MVVLECTESPDPLSIGIYRMHFTRFNMGASRDFHLWIRDPFLKSNPFTFEIKENGLQIKCSSEGSYFLNGKKTKGQRLVKTGDAFNFGETHFVLKEHHPENIGEQKDTETLLQERISEDPSLSEIFNKLDNELMRIEGLNQDDPVDI